VEDKNFAIKDVHYDFLLVRGFGERVISSWYFNPFKAGLAITIFTTRRQVQICDMDFQGN
jgi:hypothetical protein